MSSRAIPFSWLRPQVVTAVRNGWSVDRLLSDSLIERRYGDDRDVVTPEQAMLLCMNSVAAAEDATLGMARSRLPPNYPAIGARLVLGCADLEAAIRTLGRLYASTSSAVRVGLRTEQDAAILSVAADTIHEPDAVYLEEVLLIWIFTQCLHFLGRALPVLDVSVRDPCHFNLGTGHWGLHSPVRHDAVTALRFARPWLRRPPAARARANTMWECQKRLLAYVDGSHFAAPSAEFVDDAGFVRFSSLARDAGVSANTLRRRLQYSNGGFRDARRRALVDAATQALCQSEDSVEAIAASLGYSEASSFRRFVKVATGLTPQQIRDHGQAASPSGEQRVLLAIKALSEAQDL